MRPRPDETRPLILEMGEFDLQHTFAGRGALAEDVEDQAVSVDDFTRPRTLQVSLLNRCDRRVDDHQRNRRGPDTRSDRLDLARPEQR